MRTSEGSRLAIAEIEEFSYAVSAIYESAADPMKWVTALQRLSALFDASVAALISGSGSSRTLLASTAPDELQRDYDAHYHALDYVIETVEHAPSGLILTGSALVARAENSEFGQDFLHRFDLFTGLFVKLSDEPSPTTLLIAGPRNNHASETAEAIRQGDHLIAHLRQALRTQRQLADREQARAAAGDVIDAVRHGVIVVRDDHRCVQMNRAAERLIAADDGLHARAGRLGATRPATDQKLTAILRAATHGVVRAGGSMTCERSTGARPYILHILPISHHDTSTTWHHPNGDLLALVVIVDPEQVPQPTTNLLATIFGLTAAEASVALRVLAGDGLAPIADELGISTATVKTHLQRVFTKTGTHRQAELVRLLLALLP